MFLYFSWFFFHGFGLFFMFLYQEILIKMKQEIAENFLLGGGGFNELYDAVDTPTFEKRASWNKSEQVLQQICY